jgi:hypothetical protein
VEDGVRGMAWGGLVCFTLFLGLLYAVIYLFFGRAAGGGGGGPKNFFYLKGGWDGGWE